MCILWIKHSLSSQAAVTFFLYEREGLPEGLPSSTLHTNEVNEGPSKQHGRQGHGHASLHNAASTRPTSALVPDLGLIAAAIPVRRLRILLSAAAALIAATPVTAPPTAAGSRCTIGVLSTCT